jgi:hypothetical protein
MRQSTQRLVAAALILATASILATGPALAGAIININQVSTDVVVTGGGTLDTTGLTIVALNHDAVTGINPNLAFVILGQAGSVGIDEYAGATGPASFGPGGNTNPFSGSGDPFGLDQGQFQARFRALGLLGAPRPLTHTRMTSSSPDPGTQSTPCPTTPHGADPRQA